MITGFWSRLFNKGTLTPTKSETRNWQAIGRVKKSGIKFVSDMGDGEKFIHADFDVATYGGDVLARHRDEYRLNSSPITRDEYEETYRQWKIEELTFAIERNRRQKKKVSHLVAELAELETGK